MVFFCFQTFSEVSDPAESLRKPFRDELRQQACTPRHAQGAPSQDHGPGALPLHGTDQQVREKRAVVPSWVYLYKVLVFVKSRQEGCFSQIYLEPITLLQNLKGCLHLNNLEKPGKFEILEEKSGKFKIS